MASGGTSRTHYVAGRRRNQQQAPVAPVQHSDGRTFVDRDGIEYQVVWPRGRMLLSELVQNNEDQS